MDVFKKPAHVKSYWINGENQKAEKGMGGIKNDGRKGSAHIGDIAPGQTLFLADVSGCGMLRHMWFTNLQHANKEFLANLWLKIYWDGITNAAVEVPFADFFCQNCGPVVAMENHFFSNPEGRSFNCYIPMPFKTGMKIELVNHSPIKGEAMFFQIEYTIGDEWTSETRYFHSIFNDTKENISVVDHEIVPLIKGNGIYLGTSIGVVGNPLLRGTWFGEGEVKCYIDGDEKYPTLCGTGTEDYIGTGWGQGVFQNREQGCLVADYEHDIYAFYRFHALDKVFFDTDIRVTIQQIGGCVEEAKKHLIKSGAKVCRAGHTEYEDLSAPGSFIFERFGDEWRSVAYLYLDVPARTRY